VTFVWISGGLYFVLEINRSNPRQLLTLESLGGFLEGAFAPLAFLWLVLGLFIQQRELARHADELRRSTENARQDSFFNIAENVKYQLGGITGMLFASGLGTAGSGRYDRDQMDELFGKAANGDSEIFARQFLSMDFLQKERMADLRYGTEIRRRHSRNFRRMLERLLALAESGDSDGILVDSMHNTAFGLLHSRMELYTPEKLADEASN